MNFVRSTDDKPGKSDLVQLLNTKLEDSVVLYLLSGGSNLQTEVDVINHIDQGLKANLRCLLVDERFGIASHPDSNYYQLIEAGLMLGKDQFPDILEDSPSSSQALERYIAAYQKFKQQASFMVAELGIGKDGHIAGVLPNSPAVTSSNVAEYYEVAPNSRITLTLKTLREVDMALVFCFGQTKKSALGRLKVGNEQLSALPALVLNQIPHAKVYNDQL